MVNWTAINAIRTCTYDTTLSNGCFAEMKNVNRVNPNLPMVLVISLVPSDNATYDSVREAALELFACGKSQKFSFYV